MTRRWSLFLIFALLGAGAYLYLDLARSRRPNIILITLESIRPEYLGCYGGGAETSPALDALAEQGLVYEDAHSVTSWTLAAHASLFTGLYPSAHQTVGPLDRLGDSYETLAESLAAAGYQTAGFASGPYLRKKHNLSQGFEVYDESPSDSARPDDHRVAHGEITNPRMLRSIERFLDNRDRDRPFFLFGYFWDPHYDYVPPEPYDEFFVPPDAERVDVTQYGITPKVNENTSAAGMRYVKSQYRGEIRWTDDHLAKLFQRLVAEDLWEDTVIIVTADHGEEFFDHGQKGHKNNLYVESVKVPLVVKLAGPNPPRGRDPRLVSLVDIFPTLLELTGAETSNPLHGESLLDDDPRPERPIYYELLSIWYRTHPDGRQTEDREEWLAVRQQDHKLIHVPTKDRIELYDVRQDPGETRDLRAQDRDRARRMLERLEEWRTEMALSRRFFEAGGATALTPEELERLKSLGYIRF